MKPLQVWIPTLHSNLAMPDVARDARRAFDAWRGEMTVWLIPDLRKQIRWQKGPGVWATAIPAEHLDRIDVCHVGENGYVVGIGADRRFPGQRVAGLLDAWLNSHKFEICLAAQELEMQVPQVVGDRVVLKSIRFRLQPHGCLPIDTHICWGFFSSVATQENEIQNDFARSGEPGGVWSLQSGPLWSVTVRSEQARREKDAGSRAAVAGSSAKPDVCRRRN